MLALRRTVNSLKNDYGYRAGGTIALAFDFEVRKNLLYVDWNEKINNWSMGLIKDEDIEYYDVVDELEDEKDADNSADREWERKFTSS